MEFHEVLPGTPEGLLATFRLAQCLPQLLALRLELGELRP